MQPLGEVIPCGRHEADLAKPEQLPRLIRSERPDVLVNAAAYTAVDDAEEEEDLASTVNGTAVGVLAECAKNCDALLLHYSTDYVFYGCKAEPYSENDRPNPVNAYGRSKLMGERAIDQVGGDWLIFRTAWVYSPRGHNFFRTIIRLAQTRNKVTVVSDQIGAPTPARFIADCTSHILSKALVRRSQGNLECGCYNLTAKGETSWYGFACAIVESIRKNYPDFEFALSDIEPISSDAYGSRATRPANSSLDLSRVTDEFGLRLPHWEAAMELCIDEFFANLPNG